MKYKVFTKKIIYSFFLAISVMLILSGNLISFAEGTEYYAKANYDSDITFKYEYNNGQNIGQDTVYKESLETLILPYETTANNRTTIEFPYNEISNNGVRSDIKLTEVNFNMYIKDMYLAEIDDAEFKFYIKYSFTVGRRTKLNLKGTKTGSISVKTNNSRRTNEKIYEYGFNELNNFEEKLTQTGQMSYEYEIEFYLKPPYEQFIEEVDIAASSVLVEQDLLQYNGSSVIIGVNKAEVIGYSQEEINANNEAFINSESNRLDNELNDLKDDLSVSTPNPDDLLEESDPFEIIEEDKFNETASSIGDIFGSVGFFSSMVTLVLSFTLMKYVLFGKG